jgi:iron complex outermembrane receptor protein
MVSASVALGQVEQTIPSASVLRKMSVEELMNMEVTSVSRHTEKLSDTPSAVQVITSEDIRRSGAKVLPEALRLASNLSVVQLDASQWAISARGFNSPLANKMLVLIDGRTVYSPLFSGVFWDVQDTLLADVDRIEVISGPGGSLWGANAVNGVINITSKHSKDTQGVLLEGGAGSEVPVLAGFRFGGMAGPNVSYRVYGKYIDLDSTVFANGQDARDEMRMARGGFRFDWQASPDDLLTLQGDIYDGRTDQQTVRDQSTDGGNVLARWTRKLSAESDLKVQVYFDRAHRHEPGAFNDQVDTYDIDIQHRFSMFQRHDIVWGLGYRLVEDSFAGTPSLSLMPTNQSLQTFSGFLQDEIAVVKDRLHLTLGTKIEHNDYTGFEFQPNVRLAWKVTPQQLLWTSFSRTVRTPARIDRDLYIPPVTFGSPNLESETLLAYELGYRAQFFERLSVSVAGYYNNYDDIRSIEQSDPPSPVPLYFGNGQKAESYGVEVVADWHPTDWWRLRAGYTGLQMSVSPKPGSTDVSRGAAEAADSNHQFSLRSSMDLPGNIEFDAMFRWVSRLTNPSVEVPDYGELDLRLAWRPRPEWEISIVGQNLLNNHHAEYGPSLTRQEFDRAIYAKVVWHF